MADALTLDDIYNMALEVRVIEESSVKLVVFHSDSELSKVVEQIRVNSAPHAHQVPRMIVFPDMVPKGEVLCVADQETANAILQAWGVGQNRTCPETGLECFCTGQCMMAYAKASAFGGKE